MAGKTPPVVPADPSEGRPQVNAPDDDAALAAIGLPLSDGGMPPQGDEGIDYLEPQPGDERGPGTPSARLIEPTRDRAADASVVDHKEFELNERERQSILTDVGNALKHDENWPRVICMKLGRPDNIVAGLYHYRGAGMERIDFYPFQRSPPLHPRTVAGITKSVQSKPFGFYWQIFWQTPPMEMVDPDGRLIPGGGRGDCKGRSNWFDKLSGTRIETCVYGNCPRHPQPAGIHQSVWQSQRFAANLKTDSAIRNFTKLYETRGTVHTFVQLVLDQRRAAEQKSRGFDVQDRQDIVF